jgi:hypothetical protein
MGNACLAAVNARQWDTAANYLADDFTYADNEPGFGHESFGARRSFALVRWTELSGSAVCAERQAGSRREPG